ncbi:hypothetical protein KFE25_000709 [Diacronema lutheri]|uniref:Centrosomal protein POC5 n=1 Tax=Diacronema lutheri TaxID=2081491 RepID=A0A8J6CH58_DIALT|nr:hypothetical protein KFE25_000709 [Diacronema lutheri]
MAVGVASGGEEGLVEESLAAASLVGELAELYAVLPVVPNVAHRRAAQRTGGLPREPADAGEGPEAGGKCAQLAPLSVQCGGAPSCASPRAVEAGADCPSAVRRAFAVQTELETSAEHKLAAQRVKGAASCEGGEEDAVNEAGGLDVALLAHSWRSRAASLAGGLESAHAALRARELRADAELAFVAREALEAERAAALAVVEREADVQRDRARAAAAEQTAAIVERHAAGWRARAAALAADAAKRAGHEAETRASERVRATAGLRRAHAVLRARALRVERARLVRLCFSTWRAVCARARSASAQLALALRSVDAQRWMSAAAESRAALALQLWRRAVLAQRAEDTAAERIDFAADLLEATQRVRALAAYRSAHEPRHARPDIGSTAVPALSRDVRSLLYSAATHSALASADAGSSARPRLGSLAADAGLLGEGGGAIAPPSPTNSTASWADSLARWDEAQAPTVSAQRPSDRFSLASTRPGSLASALPPQKLSGHEPIESMRAGAGDELDALPPAAAGVRLADGELHVRQGAPYDAGPSALAPAAAGVRPAGGELLACAHSARGSRGFDPSAHPPAAAGALPAVHQLSRALREHAEARATAASASVEAGVAAHPAALHASRDAHRRRAPLVGGVHVETVAAMRLAKLTDQGATVRQLQAKVSAQDAQLATLSKWCRVQRDSMLRHQVPLLRTYLPHRLGESHARDLEQLFAAGERI